MSKRTGAYAATIKAELLLFFSLDDVLIHTIYVETFILFDFELALSLFYNVQNHCYEKTGVKLKQFQSLFFKKKTTTTKQYYQ